MSTLSDSFLLALGLIRHLDAHFVDIVGLSLRVSLTSTACAALIGLPLGALIAIERFPGRGAVVAVLNAMMGLPPVVVGLLVYLLLSRAGPLGSFGILFTPSAMVVAQTILIAPIIAALTRQVVEDAWHDYGDMLASLHARTLDRALTLLWDTRYALATVLMAGFGRAASEVGAIIIVGGNIDGVTRVMTTAIALETSQGDLPLALALGIVLIAIVVLLNFGAHATREWARAGLVEPAAAAGLPIALAGVTVRRGHVTPLRDVDLTVAPRECTVVIGPNGSGKSTLLRVLHGLLAPSEGSISWGGAPAPPRNQAMVFQRSVLLRRSAAANIEYALRLAGFPPDEWAARAFSALEHAGLASLARRPARRLSGGEQQRVALARAAALEPDLLFLDEPTASLDPGASGAIEERVQAIRDGGTTIVMSTHNLAQALRLAERVVFLQGGRLVEVTPAAEFFRAPRSAEAAAFLEGERI